MERFFVRGALLGAAWVLTTTTGCLIAYAAGAQGIGRLAIGSSPVETTIQAGSLASDIIMWTWVIGGPALAGLIGTYVFRLLQKESYNLDEQQRFRLRQLIEHGLAVGAALAAQAVQKNPSLDVKNAMLASALEFVRKQGNAELKVLGLGLDFEKEQETLRALIAAELSTLHPEHPASLLGAWTTVKSATDDLKDTDRRNATPYDPTKALVPDLKALLASDKTS